MKQTHRSFNLLATIVVLALVLSACGGGEPAAGERQPQTAALSEIEGVVESKGPGEAAFAQVVAGLVLQVGSQIQTGAGSKVRLDISDGTILRLGPQTLFAFEGEEEVADGSFLTKVGVQAGQLFIILSGGALEVDTPSGVASVRGSYMEVRIDPVTGDITITCLEGDCNAQTNGGEVSFSAGQTATITSDQLPPELGEMTAEDVLNWLQQNPEATVVIVPLTATVEGRATDTPEVSDTPTVTATFESSNTPTPVPPTNTPESPSLTMTGDALCMSGPGRDRYVVIGTVFIGQTANVVGQNSTHWVIEFPGRPGVVCWIPKGNANANVAAQSVRIFGAPPTTTPTPKPTKEKPTDVPPTDEKPTATPCPEGRADQVFLVSLNSFGDILGNQIDPCYYYDYGYAGLITTRAMVDLLSLTAKQ